MDGIIRLPSLLLSTVLLRPYVFLFLLAFLVSARRWMGWRRTLIFMGLTWATAFLAEFSSTRNGFPFGLYYYIPGTQDRELWISNVPFMDSLSFTFLLYASYTLALVFLLPSTRTEGQIILANHPGKKGSFVVLLLAVTFFVYADIVIDPVALRGDRWFLGKIFDYPDGGIYFGVPVSNFIGWAVVGLVALSLFQWCDSLLHPPQAEKGLSPSGIPFVLLLPGVLLYYAVLIFNLGVTFWIGEGLLGMVGILLFLPLTLLLVIRVAGLYPHTSSGIIRRWTGFP